MYFKRRDNFKSEYPEDLIKIRKYLNSIGTLDCTDEELDNAWRDFSDEWYSASWIHPERNFLETFVLYLEGLLFDF